MKRKRSKSMMALLASASLMACVPVAQAQQIGQLVAGADAAAAKRDTAKAYELYKQATELYSPERAAKIFGPRMGYLWYRRGLCAMQVAQTATRGNDEAAQTRATAMFKDATKSFDKSAGIGKSVAENPFQNISILRIGKCKQLQKDYSGAIQAYGTFTANYNKKIKQERQAFNPGQLKLDLAMCYFKKNSPDLAKGGDALTWVMKPENKERYRVPNAAIVAGFQAYCAATISKINELKVGNKDKKKNPAIDKIEKDLTIYIAKNRGTITLPAYQMYAYVPHFLKIAQDMKILGLDQASFAIMGFLPDSITAKEEMEQKVSDLGGQRVMVDHYDIIYLSNIEKDLETLTKRIDGGVSHETVQDIITASIYETEGNYRAAYAIFEMAEMYNKNSPKREEFLYNLVRTSYQIGEIFKTSEYGQRYIEDFPKGSHRGDVEKFMLTALFQNGRYEECVTIASKLISKLTPGTIQHDLALYCLGGSYFYLGQQLKAVEPLAQHRKLYGKNSKAPSAHAVAVQYWDAANQIYLGNWENAADKLDVFLKDYPNPEENHYYVFAKYDRASCYTNINDQSQKSIDTLKEIIDNYPSHSIIDRAYTLRGNNYQTLDDLPAALADYQKALEISQRANNAGVEAEVLKYLIAMLGDGSVKANTPEEKAEKANNLKLAVKYYDIFWDKYNDTAYKAEVATAGIAPMRASNRGKEALANLKQVIMEQAQLEDAPGMDRAINTYTDEYLAEEGNTPYKLKEHYLKDFNLRSSQVRALALVKMSLVETYGTLKKVALSEKDDAAVEKWDGAIKAELAEMASFDLSKLPNYVLVSIGNNIVKTAVSQDMYAGAALFFNQVLKNKKENKDGTYLNEATFGLATVLVETQDPASMAKAYTELDKIFAKAAEKRIKEKALFYMVSIAKSQNNLDLTIEKAQQFLNTFKGSAKRVPVRLTLADAYFNNGEKTKANKNYRSIVQSAAGNFTYSCPAMLKIIKINETSDLYATWVGANDFIQLTTKAYEKNIAKLSNKEKSEWEQIRDFVEETEGEVAAEIAKAKAEENERRRLKGQKPLPN